MKPWWLDTDSYKFSHFLQFPPGMTRMQSHLVARVGPPTVFFGLRYVLQQLNDCLPFDGIELDEAEAFAGEHGVPFNREGFRHVIDNLMYWPVTIRARPEGALVAAGEPMLTVTSTDPRTAWIVGWLETRLVRLWYPINIATLGFYRRQRLRDFAERTIDTESARTAWLNFAIHDFGARGASSAEAAALGGAAHLINFRGTDTVLALKLLERFYDGGVDGYSLPAMEHATVGAWGANDENLAYLNMVETFASRDAAFAAVSDTYDYERAVRTHWRILRDKVKSRGARVVIRPDSGDHVQTALDSLGWLAEDWGYSINSRGYKVLHPSVRLILGDGMTDGRIERVCELLASQKWSVENIFFGLGGALHTGHTRDTFGMAYKCNAVTVDGVDRAVYKAPKDAPWKASHRGGYIDDARLTTVFHDGALIDPPTFDGIRAAVDEAHRLGAIVREAQPVSIPRLTLVPNGPND